MTLLSDEAAAAIYAAPVIIEPQHRPTKPTAIRRAGRRLVPVSIDPTLTGAIARRSSGGLGAAVALAAAKAEPRPAREPRPRTPDDSLWNAADARANVRAQLAVAAAQDERRQRAARRESERWRERHGLSVSH